VRHLRVSFFFLAVAVTLSGCGIFGGSDGSEVATAEDFEAQPTPNNVQQVPAESASEAAGENPSVPAAEGTAPLPTAITLPTAAPTPEPTVDRSQPTTYIVQSGDVLGLIAERFDADIAELRSVNDLDGNLIRVGQELTIPALDGSTTTTDATESSDTTELAAPSAPAATVSCNSAATGHCVQPGESLLGIAVQYDVTVESLRAANPGVSGDLIKSGEVLNLPGATTTTDSASAAPVTTTDPAVIAEPTAQVIAARSDAECAAANPTFPYFHDFGDGRIGCYANPFGDSAEASPTASAQELADAEQCPVNHVLYDIGDGSGLLCYPFDGGVTVTATAVPTGTAGVGTDLNYGRPPCRDGYVVLTGTNRCWPEATNTSPATVTPTGTTTTNGATQACADPNFIEDALGRCFLTQVGLDAGCEVVDNVARCNA